MLRLPLAVFGVVFGVTCVTGMAISLAVSTVVDGFTGRDDKEKPNFDLAA
ncbi:hypothetical protein [Naasia lichenicola]|nr:hypothetical protein [Naasia lichenicola]